MALSFPSTVFAVSVPSVKATNCSKSMGSFGSSKSNPLHFNSFLFCPSIPFQSNKIKTLILQENEEKVAVEESFTSKTIIDCEEKRCCGELSETQSASASEKWVIKIEKSVNVFLTEMVIKILDTLYHDRDYARFFVLENIARVPHFENSSDVFVNIRNDEAEHCKRVRSTRIFRAYTTQHRYKFCFKI